MTDALGNPYEFMLYLPFGEAMAQQKVAGWATPYTFTGKEVDGLTGLHYFGARYLDSRLSMWFGVDPMAHKFPYESPYTYVSNNPIRYNDPTGMEKDDIIILFSVTGNTKGDESFKAAMETRRDNIINSPAFNPEKDIVLSFKIESLSEIGTLAANASSTYGEQFGKVSEVGIWSHSGNADGPVGSKPAAEGDALSIGSKQMSLNGWNNTNIDWKKKANCSFYGCNSASGGETSFSSKVSKLESFQNVGVIGQNGYTYPSFSPKERTTSLTREYLPSVGFSRGQTYFVGGERGEGFRSMWFTGNDPKAAKMTRFVNGGKSGSSHQKSWY